MRHKLHHCCTVLHQTTFIQRISRALFPAKLPSSTFSNKNSYEKIMKLDEPVLKIFPQLHTHKFPKFQLQKFL